MLNLESGNLYLPLNYNKLITSTSSEFCSDQLPANTGFNAISEIWIPIWDLNPATVVFLANALGTELLEIFFIVIEDIVQ